MMESSNILPLQIGPISVGASQLALKGNLTLENYFRISETNSQQFHSGPVLACLRKSKQPAK
jgi:hypothetical protein